MSDIESLPLGHAVSTKPEEPQQEVPVDETYKSPYNLEYFLEHYEDVCPEDFEGFTQKHFDRIGNMFFALEFGQSAKRLAPPKPEKLKKSSNQEKILCECGSTINKSSMKSHIKTKRHLLHQAFASSVVISSDTHLISLLVSPYPS